MSKSIRATSRDITDHFSNRRAAVRWSVELSAAGCYPRITGPHGHVGSTFRWRVEWTDYTPAALAVDLPQAQRIKKLTAQVVKAVQLRTAADARASKRNVAALEDRARDLEKLCHLIAELHTGANGFSRDDVLGVLADYDLDTASAIAFAKRLGVNWSP